MGNEPISNQELARLYVEVYGGRYSGSDDPGNDEARAKAIAAYAQPIITPEVEKFYKSFWHYSGSPIKNVIADINKHLGRNGIFFDDLDDLVEAVVLGKVEDLRATIARRRNPVAMSDHFYDGNKVNIKCSLRCYSNIPKADLDDETQDYPIFRIE
ncbi:hypothetical protein HYU06_02860 [Candidatus Woesearchaeota archaeon]|nr:hypothetical protein [Candidatus Woesearchaeota archaeon]